MICLPFCNKKTMIKQLFTLIPNAGQKSLKKFFSFLEMKILVVIKIDYYQ